MTKKEIVKKIAEQSGVSRQVALEAVQMVFDGIMETLVEEGRIESLPQSTHVPAFRWQNKGPRHFVGPCGETCVVLPGPSW